MGQITDEQDIEIDEAAREKAGRNFWKSQLKYKCFYDCATCVVKRTAIDLAKEADGIDAVRSNLPNTSVCDVVVTYSTPYWWNPFYGRFTFLIVSDRGDHELFRVCRMNVKNLFRRGDPG